jgi:hypothetical protein
MSRRNAGSSSTTNIRAPALSRIGGIGAALRRADPLIAMLNPSEAVTGGERFFMIPAQLTLIDPIRRIDRVRNGDAMVADRMVIAVNIESKRWFKVQGAKCHDLPYIFLRDGHVAFSTPLR